MGEDRDPARSTHAPSPRRQVGIVEPGTDAEGQNVVAVPTAFIARRYQALGNSRTGLLEVGKTRRGERLEVVRDEYGVKAARPGELGQLVRREFPITREARVDVRHYPNRKTLPRRPATSPTAGQGSSGRSISFRVRGGCLPKKLRSPDRRDGNRPGNPGGGPRSTRNVR